MSDIWKELGGEQQQIIADRDKKIAKLQNAKPKTIVQTKVVKIKSGGKVVSKPLIRENKTTIVLSKPREYILIPTDTFKSKFEKDKRNFFFE